MKIKKLYIDNYKMFKNFEIDFTDKDNNPLDIIVLAGVNGSGKTTLLEYLYNFMERLNSRGLLINDFIEISLQKEPKGLGSLSSNNYTQGLSSFALNNYPLPFECHKIENNNFKEYMTRYKQNIMYLPIYENSLEDIKNSILIFYRIISRELDSHTKAVKKIQNIIDNFFKNMDINLIIADINDINKNDEKIIFKNKSGDTFEIEELSTGQKTLLSKILYLHFNKISNKTILIDEPELSLHPAWQNRVLKLYENFAKENNCQIIIATHSPHIIGSAKNEYIRVLTTNENNEIKVLDKDIYAHGRDINSILFDVMNEARYRPLKEFDEKIDYLYHYIDEQDFDKAKEILQELEKDYGKNDRVILEAKMTIDMLSHQDL